jgi:hypothetical protein
MGGERIKSLFIVLGVVLFIGLVCGTPVSAEVDRVPAINTATDQPVIIPQAVLELSPVFQLAQVVVEVEDGAFFLLASGDDPADRQAFIQVLYATLKEQLHVRSEVTNYESFSIVKVIAATADEVEPILQSFINCYVVGVFFFGGSAYSFAW